MVGGGRERAADILLRMDISGEAENIRAPLLQLHGAPDQVFLLENARRLHDLAGSTDKRLLIWEDGDHCIYNHSEEKHIVVADWFASQLLR
jgi:esterase/lipase